MPQQILDEHMQEDKPVTIKPILGDKYILGLQIFMECIIVYFLMPFIFFKFGFITSAITFLLVSFFSLKLIFVVAYGVTYKVPINKLWLAISLFYRAICTSIFLSEGNLYDGMGILFHLFTGVIIFFVMSVFSFIGIVYLLNLREEKVTKGYRIN